MTDILYVANARVPSRKAHSYQIIQMCDAFVQNGDDVELLLPERKQPADAPTSADDYYDIQIGFGTKYLSCLDVLWVTPPSIGLLNRLVFYLQTVTFTITALVYTMRQDFDIVYTRSRLFGMVGALLFGEKVVVEIHRSPSRDLVTKITGATYDRCRGLVLISEGLEEKWAAVTDAPTHVAPDGVNLDRFRVGRSKEEMRADLGLPSGPLVCYTGSLQPWKGVDTLVTAAGTLQGTTVCLVGGTPDQQEWLRNAVTAPENLHLIGHVSPSQVPKYLAASDVLVVPNTANREISARYTSPLKLFEYMAAERPIVATDIPSLREILDEEMAYFAVPDDPDSLAGTIELALTDPDASRRASNAGERVQEYTWQARARNISEALFDCSEEDQD